MQRWIVTGVVAAILVLGGGVFAYWNYKQNLPAPLWVPLRVNADRTDEELAELTMDLKAKLDSPTILIQISKDLDLTHKWNMPSDEAAAGELSKRLFVKPGEADTAMGKVPSINVGVEGKRKEMKVTGEIATRLMMETFKLLGIKPPPAK